MRADRPLRLPLQIGTSALTSLVRGSAFFVPGAILIGVPLGFLIYMQVDAGDATGYVLLPGFIVISFAWKHLKRARAERPSDLELTADGFELRGGPASGRRIAWSGISRVAVEQPSMPKGTEEDD